MTREYELIRVNAFGNGLGLGNPCAVVLDAADLLDVTMQRIAHDLGLAETAFVTRLDGLSAAARYFTPALEIPLAGHPTLAVARALVETGRLENRSEPLVLSLELPAGLVEVEISSNGSVTRSTMAQRPPEFGRTYPADEVASAFGLEPSDLLPGAPAQIVSTGTPQLMVPLGSRAALDRARIVEELYRPLRAEGGFFSPHLFILEGYTEGGDTAARHLDVAPDVPEDPFTGSATGGMGAFLWRHGLIDTPRFRAQQGHSIGRPGIAEVEVVGPPDSIRTVRVSGDAVTVIRGRIRLETAEDEDE